MIHTSKTVAVGNQESIIDSPIVLYRGDREVEVEFTLTGNKYTFSNGGNVIKSVNATHGQLVLNTPTGENAFSEVTECHDGKVVFIITKEMIDELIEVGFYSFQIRLFDENQVSRVSIPPVYKGIDIRNPIAAEDETNAVDIGLVDYAVVVKDEFEDLSTFLPDGNYNKTEWESKDVISGAKLNKIEDALYNINSNMEATDLALLNMVENINKNVRSEINKLGNELESEVEQFKSLISIDNDVARHRYTNQSTGNISEFNIIDGGIEFINTPDGGHGYAAKGKLYEELMPTELNNQNNYYSHVMLEDYNKHGVIDGYLEIGMGIGHNDQLVGRCNLYSKSSDFTLREVVTYGNEYIYYSDTTSQQGFYAGNGMYIKDERTTVTVPAKEGYQFVEIPIRTKYTYSPFLISCNLHYGEPYDDTVSYDVFIRTSQISKLSDGSHVVRVLLKHNKPSEITLRFSNILCGYMEYKNRIKK